MALQEIFVQLGCFRDNVWAVTYRAILSPKTVKQSSLRIDMDNLVPSRPCLSATSQKFIHTFPQQC